MTLFKICQHFFHQTFMRFHSAIATLKPQKFVVHIAVWTEITLPVSGRIVQKIVESEIIEGVFMSVFFGPKISATSIILGHISLSAHFKYLFKHMSYEFNFFVVEFFLNILCLWESSET